MNELPRKRSGVTEKAIDVIVVEDDDDTRMMIAALLTANDCLATADAAHDAARRLQHHRDDAGLRDRLRLGDRQRAIVVGAPRELRGHERLARHGAHRREHARIRHASRDELDVDHRAPLPFEGVHASGSPRSVPLPTSDSCRPASHHPQGWYRAARSFWETRWGKMTRSILIVDDDPRNVALLVSLLGPFAADLRTATGGREALASIGQRAPDLVLLDLAMPDLDGIDVLTHLRETHGPHIPVIVVTAHGEREQRLEAVEAGADEFLEKPIDRAILHARVKTLLALKSSRYELAARHAALVSVQREQREMMHFIVHDLRTPLMVVQTSLSYAGESLTSDPQEAIDALRDASESIVRVNDLVTDMLSVSRLEQAQMRLDRSRVQLDAFVERLTSLYGRKAKARRIAIESHIDRVAVSADAALLRRVLENILDNSLRHTPAGGRVGLDASKAGEKVRIAISNSGPSVPPDERAAIFEKFSRGTSPGSRPGAVGLGLYFCKRVVEAHGGQIQVEDTPRWPTSFVIDLPAD